MELKTTADMKDLLSRAAALDGLDLTSFVLGPAIEKARRVLSEHARKFTGQTRAVSVGANASGSAQTHEGDENFDGAARPAFDQTVPP